MSKTPSHTTETTSTSTNQTQGVVTRSQTKRNDTNNPNSPDQNSNSNNDRHDASRCRGKEKEKEKFKGGVTEMNGHVFQLYEESRKANQFSTTWTQLKKYVAVECDQTKDLAPLFEETIKQPTLIEPSDAPPMKDKESRQYLAWRASCEKFDERQLTLRSNLNKVFAVILSQSSESLKPKIESTSRYKKAEKDDDCGWLLTTIKNICHRFEHSENRFTALIKAKSAIFNCKQSPHQSTTEYYETFKELVSVLESYGGVLNDPPNATPADSKLLTITDDNEKATYVKGKYAAILFIMNSDRQRALEMMIIHGRPKTDPDGAAVTAAEAENLNEDEVKQGEEMEGEAEEQLQRDEATTETKIEDHFPEGIPDHYILLDSDSTVSIFRNKDYLSNVRDAEHPLRLQTNGGSQTTHQVGTIADIGDVWYNPDSIANILSLAQVRKVRRVTMDTGVEAAFHVHRPDGGVTIFHEHPSGLYLHEVPQRGDNPTSPNVIAYSNFQTVAKNKTKFTNRQVELADEARRLHHLLGRPSVERLIHAITKNLIINCPLTVEDIKRAEEIYSKDVAFIKGKTTANPPKEHIASYTAVELPRSLLEHHRNVTLCFDIFYILGLTFSISTSRNIKYISCRYLPDRNKASIKKCIKADLDLYNVRGFNVVNIHCDGEYHGYATHFPNVHFSICSANDHVPEAERAIRTIKETVRATIHGMPFRYLPRIMVREIVTFAARVNNMLQANDGISDTMSPDTIVNGHPKPDYRNMKLEFRTYVQVYDGTSNDTKSRTLGAITLNATENTNGDYYFLSLATGERLHQRSWSILPISDLVISRVEAIAKQEMMPPIDGNNRITEHDPDEIVDDSAYDKDYLPPTRQPPKADHELTTDAYTDTESEPEDETDDVGHRAEYDDESIYNNPAPKPLSDTTVLPTDDQSEGHGDELQPGDVTDPECDLRRPLRKQTTIETKNEQPVTVQPGKGEERHRPKHPPPPVREEERQEEERTNMNEEKRQSLRPNRQADYSYRFGFAQSDDHRTPPVGMTWSDVQRAVLHTDIPTSDGKTRNGSEPEHIRKALYGLVFTQMSAIKGIRKHGQAAWDALKKEFEQFRHLEVLEPLDAFTLTDDQKAEALRAISVIKEKCNGTLKGRTVADGRAQRGKYSKTETASPTMSNDALFMTIMIDAYEQRDVATADISGAYLHAHMKDFVCLRFTGWAVDLLCEVNPEYERFVVYEGKTKVLYLRCNKAIYGCVVSGMLWYELFVSVLENEGFKINPYDFCVANATIDGKQCTVGWYVDDTKISHIKPPVVDRILALLERHFGKLTITRGREHDFLGMHITYNGDGTASIHMPSYIQEAIDESQLNITNNAPTLCANTLFNVDETSPTLDATRAAIFHSIVAKLIYVGTRARADILLALAFLCGRVSKPTHQDETKLKRLLEYLRGTIDMPLIIGADSLASFFTWVDASFAVHNNMRSHTGGVVSFGRGGLICKSSKQKINTKSSTEAELIAASDYLPHTIYVKHFMAAQGYPIEKSVFYQDNESAIKLERNGKASSGQRTRHIDIRHFFYYRSL